MEAYKEVPGWREGVTDSIEAKKHHSEWEAVGMEAAVALAVHWAEGVMMEEELLEEVEMRVELLGEKAGEDCQATVGTMVVVGYTHPVVLAEVVVVERQVVVLGGREGKQVAIQVEESAGVEAVGRAAMGEENKAMSKAEEEEAAMEED
ncbi:MAG: hypothetical protein SGPRY_001928 [Prymnesium sp.]